MKSMSGRQKVIEAWMGFSEGVPHVYKQDGNGNNVLDVYIKKKEARRAYEDVRPVRLTWWEETPVRRT